MPVMTRTRHSRERARPRIICVGKMKRQNEISESQDRGKGGTRRRATKDERNKRVGRKMKRFLPNGCRGERKERPGRTRERGATSRKVVQVTDVETRGNDYFFIF